MKTAIIEKYDTLGGTCLNVGCIPSKALLDSSEHYHNAAHTFKTHGIDLDNLKVNLKQMIDRKAGVVTDNVNGIAFLMKKNKIDVHHGMGAFIDKHNIKITDKEGKTSQIETDKVIIATGSKPSSLPFIKIDKKRVITSTEALEMTEIPKHMIVIGGGVIGMELGSVYARLGAEVSVVEFMDELIPSMDSTMGKELRKSLKKLGFNFYLCHKVTEVKGTAKTVTVKAENKQGEVVEINGDYCLVSIGRKPYTEGLGLENVGIKTDERGRIPVDAHLRTEADNIYAIGDVIKGAMLAHKAE
jgi:dihydrolipoamide dehydrogenase